MASYYSPYLNWINSQEQTLLYRVKQWVSVNSFSFNIEGLTRLCYLLESSFKSLNADLSVLDLPQQVILNQDGIFQSRPLGPALVLRKRPHAPIQVLLGGHFDTVFSPSHSFQNIDESTPGRWKGPGTADMKGGLAILLTTLEALERSPFAEKIGWEVILNPDEEIGSPGSGCLYENAARHHHCGLIFEPSFPDGAFVNERKGSATYTLGVYGKAAHVGRDFLEGRSAVFALMHFIQKLESLKTRQGIIINVADVEGKGPVNIVPPFATCRINIRSENADDLAKASDRLQEFAGECQEDGILIKIMQDSFRAPKPFHSQTQHLFRSYANCAHELNIPFQMRATGGVCDGNILAGAGLPTLDTAGAIGGGLHTDEEYLICSSLVERAKLAALFLFKLATQEVTIKMEIDDGK